MEEVSHQEPYKSMYLRTVTITTEHLLYLLAFCIALVLRFLNLGDTPLSDFEAAKAIQSWYAVHGGFINIGSDPGYFSLTTLLFQILPVKNATARFWPALVGSLVVLAPFGLRRLFRPEAALVIAFGFALDPGMVTLSRLAGGPMMAIGFGILSLVFIFHRKPLWVGIACGLALISGPAVFTGLLSLLVTFVVGMLVGLPRRFDASVETEIDRDFVPSRGEARYGMIIGVVTILLASTFLFRYPGGIGALGNALGDYLKGWITDSKTPVLQPLFALIVYQPLALIFAFVSTIRGWIQNNPISRWLSIWTLVVLLITTLYPGRQVYDVVWALIPLWGLAALEISRHLKKSQYSIPTVSLAGAIVVLCTLFWLMSLNPAPISVSWVILVIVPVLILILVSMVGFTWSWDSARCGAIWGFSIAIGIYIIAVLFEAAYLRFNRPEELWTPPPGTGQTDLLKDTIEELALIQNGRIDTIDIVSNVELPSLKWVLKEFSNVQYVSILDQVPSSSVYITEENPSREMDFSRLASYYGQDFIWSVKPGWTGSLPPEWWQWLTTREVPIQYESLILWARSDFFPDQLQIEPASLSSPSSESDDIVQQQGPIE